MNGKYLTCSVDVFLSRNGSNRCFESFEETFPCVPRLRIWPLLVEPFPHHELVEMVFGSVLGITEYLGPFGVCDVCKGDDL